jgi:nucleotide-binding universal stress UspA family protein
MKTILIPTDFSEPAINAVNYAVELSNHQDIDQIILFSQYYVSLFEHMYPSADLIQPSDDDMQEKKQGIIKQLEDLKVQVMQRLKPGINVKIVLLESSLFRAVLNMIEKEKPDVLFIGSNNHDGEESFIGSHMIEIAKISPVPVMIIPPKTHYKPILSAVVACDFRTLNHVSLLQRLHKIKHWPHPKLALLNVDPNKKHLRPEHPALEIKGIINEVLKDYDYKIHYSDEDDILQGVLQFADQNHQQMIIALPGVHSFLYSLTHQSITEGLSKDANKPVLILK